MNQLGQFMLGAQVICCLAIGLFFLRFWRRTSDRLFLIFAVAFWMMGTNWLVIALTEQDELRTAFYFMRFVAFLLIIIGIVDKNRSAGGDASMPPGKRSDS